MSSINGLLHSIVDFGHTFSGILAQRGQAEEAMWAKAFMDMDTGKLAILLIFGTGLISVTGYALSSMIRAYHAAPDESEEITEQIAALEKRIGELERQQTSSMV